MRAIINLDHADPDLKSRVSQIRRELECRGVPCTLPLEWQVATRRPGKMKDVVFQNIVNGLARPVGAVVRFADDIT
ncbi:MAG: hypothetical protein Q8Q06_03280 [bacterium]|nr:hypothetical protein [bacterium]